MSTKIWNPDTVGKKCDVDQGPCNCGAWHVLSSPTVTDYFIRQEISDSNPKDLIGVKKPRLSLIPPSSLVYQAIAMEDGAAKYGPYNWREKKVSASIYVDAAMRHLLAFYDGEADAADSKKPHLAHALGCIGILVDALETKNLIDDRPKAGATAALIERYTKK